MHEEWKAERAYSWKEWSGVLWTLPRAYECTRADMPTADSIAVDSIPSFKPEPERAYSRTVTRVINGGFALKSFFSSLKAKSSSASNQSPIVWYPFSLSARNRPHRIVRMRILILKIAYSWYSLPNSLFYSEFLLNVVHSLAFGWGKSSSLPNLPKRRYSLKQ